MRIMLLHDDIYVPSLGGGVRVNRCLMEQMARRGHSCLAVAHALTRSQDGPRTVDQFRNEMHKRGIAFSQPHPQAFRYRHLGVQVDALLAELSEATQDYLRRRVDEFAPDLIVATEDKRGFLLRTAMELRPKRVVVLLQTVTNLPFGPLSVRPDPTQARLVHEARAVVVISGFLDDYIREHSQLKPCLIPLPVFGDGPFPVLADPTRGYVTMINPCALKGLSIFLALAKRFPDIAFAAVPTWGANDDVLRRLASCPNVAVLPAADDIEEILKQTRVLLAPSLWPETFGLVAPEAMLRGIPVLASNVCGLPYSKLSVDYVLPVRPAVWRDEAWHCPDQDVESWADTLAHLLGDPSEYSRVSQESLQASRRYVAEIDIGHLERLFKDVLDSDRALPERRVVVGQPHHIRNGFTN